MELNLLIDNKNHYFDEYLSLIKTTVDSEEKNIEIESHRIDSLRPSTPIDGIEWLKDDLSWKSHSAK